MLLPPIRLRVHVRVYSHSNQLRRLFFELKPSFLRASPSPYAERTFPYYFSALFSRRIVRLLRRLVQYAGRASHRRYPSGRVLVVDTANV